MAAKKTVFYGGKTYKLGLKKNQYDPAATKATKPAGLPGPKTRSQKIKGGRGVNATATMNKGYMKTRQAAARSGKGTTYAKTGTMSANLRNVASQVRNLRAGGATG